MEIQGVYENLRERSFRSEIIPIDWISSFTTPAFEDGVAHEDHTSLLVPTVLASDCSFTVSCPLSKAPMV